MNNEYVSLSLSNSLMSTGQKKFIPKSSLFTRVESAFTYLWWWIDLTNEYFYKDITLSKSILNSCK